MAFLASLPPVAFTHAPAMLEALQTVTASYRDEGWEWVPPHAVGLTDAPVLSRYAVHNALGMYIYNDRRYIIQGYPAINPLRALQQAGVLMLRGVAGDVADLRQHSVLTWLADGDIRLALCDDGIRWLAVAATRRRPSLHDVVVEHGSHWQVGEEVSPLDPLARTALIHNTSTKRTYVYLGRGDPLAVLEREGQVTFHLRR